MLREELEQLVSSLASREEMSRNIKTYTAEDSCPLRLYDVLSGFSNADGGGILLFGVDLEKGFRICGVYNAPDLERKVADQCAGMIPKVLPVFTEMLYRGRIVVSCEVPSVDLSERPCYYSGIGKARGSFITVDGVTSPLSDYEIYTYDSYKSHSRSDERPVNRAALGLMDTALLGDYMARMRVAHPGLSRVSDEQAYDFLGITRNGVPTVAAVLNFALYPQGFFPQYAITAVSVPGTEIGDVTAGHSRFLDNKRIEGTLPAMLDGALAFCLRNMRTTVGIDPLTGERRDTPEYPVDAIREAVLNALIHRDYSPWTEGTPIQLCMFTDRLEIHSPGSLYGRMTVDDLGYAKMDVRNPSLAAMSEHLLRTENRYSGIPTMRRELKRAGLSAPMFENRRNEFVVIFSNRPASREEDRETAGLLEYCMVPRTRNEVAAFLGIESVSYAVMKYINPLVEQGKLRYTIPDKPKSPKQMFVTREAR